jgi:hypothetical protein
MTSSARSKSKAKVKDLQDIVTVIPASVDEPRPPNAVETRVLSCLVEGDHMPFEVQTAADTMIMRLKRLIHQEAADRLADNTASELILLKVRISQSPAQT